MIRYPDPADFHASVVDVRRAASLLAEAHGHADGQVSLLLDGGWSGAAADAFGEAWRDWARAASLVVRDLEASAEVLARVHAMSVTVDLEAVDRMRPLKGPLQGAAR